MSHPQCVIRMQRCDSASLGPLRQRPGLEVCLHTDALWLRIISHDDDLDATIRALPGRRFNVLSDRQLVLAGEHVPQGYLPEGPWVGLSEWMAVEAGSASFCGKITEKIRLNLVRGGRPVEANILLTTVGCWREYAVDAPQVRLDRWAFAISDDRQVVIRGTPLPPLPGLRFVERSGVATPVGYTWSPAVDAKVVREMLTLRENDLALFQSDDDWNHIRSDDFVRATRSAVRTSTDVVEND